MDWTVYALAVSASVIIVGLNLAASILALSPNWPLMRTDGMLTAKLLGLCGLIIIWGDAIPLLVDMSPGGRDQWLAWITLWSGTKMWVLVMLWRLLAVARCTNRWFARWTRKRSTFVLFMNATLLSVLIFSWSPQPSAMPMVTMRAGYLSIAYAPIAILSMFLLLTTPMCKMDPVFKACLVALATAVVAVAGHFVLWPVSLGAVVASECLLHATIAFFLVFPFLMNQEMGPLHMRKHPLWDQYFVTVYELSTVPAALARFVDRFVDADLSESLDLAQSWLEAKYCNASQRKMENIIDAYKQRYRRKGSTPESAVAEEFRIIEEKRGHHLRKWKTQTLLQEAVRQDYIKQRNRKDGLLCHDDADTEGTTIDDAESESDWSYQELMPNPNGRRILSCDDDAASTSSGEVVYAELNNFQPG